MSSPQPKIAIIGGGPAGLTAGVLLYRRGVPFTIFELRQKPTIEELAQPSGMLDLHEESGLAAIRECNLFDDFLPLTGDCSQVAKMSDKDGNMIVEEAPHWEYRPEISRHALSQLLMSQLPGETIRWGHKLLSATSTSCSTSGHTETELDFGVHGKQTFDMVIGADGAWSRVRNLLTDVKPKYSGRQVITLTMKSITKRYPDLAQFIGPGSFFALGDRHGVTTQRGPQDSARVYIFITTPDEHFPTTSGLASETAAWAKKKLLGDDTQFGQWGSILKKLVTVACDDESADNSEKLDIKPLYGLPIGHAWGHKPGTTLIGDAAHLMPPSGEGVNMGMLDSLLLSQAIIRAYAEATATQNDATSFLSALDPLVREVEVDMAARAHVKAEEAYMLQEVMFAEDGAAAMSRMVQQHKIAAEGKET